MRSLHRGIEDKYDGKWTDMSEMKDSLIERAYSQLNEKLGSKETFTSISLAYSVEIERLGRRN